MTPRSILLSIVLLASTSAAGAQTVIVPETPFSGTVSLMANATAMLDHDSVLMTYTRHASFLGNAELQVINIGTGATELPAVPFPDGMRVSSVAALSPVSALVAVRDDNSGAGSKGKYFVVNAITGTIVRGPVPFTVHGTGWGYSIAVIDASTVLIAHRSDAGWAGVFTVIDPQTGSVKVPETPFAPNINTVDVVTLDANRVAMVYGTTGPDFRMFFTVVNPQTGSVVRAPEEMDGDGPAAVEVRESGDLVVAFYDDGASKFLTLNPVTGTRSPATTFATGGVFSPDISLVGDRSVFIAWSHTGDADAPGEYALYDLDGSLLVPRTPFNPEGPTYFVSAASSGCRTLLSYQDVDDNQIGKFQVFDFAGLCSPPPCPPNITGDLDFFASFFVPFFVPELQLQLVLVRSRTGQPIVGPFSLVLEDLQNATLLGGRGTACSSTGPSPSIRLSAGADDVLSPGEFGGAFLLFLKTADPITYQPRILNGMTDR